MCSCHCFQSERILFRLKSNSMDYKYSKDSHQGENIGKQVVAS